MRILALSDIHSEQRVLDGLRSRLTRGRYDAIFIAGDTADYNDTLFFDGLIDLIGKIPLYIIPGNMDDVLVQERIGRLDKCVELEKKRLTSKYEVFGIGGGLRGPFHTPYEYYDDELGEKIKDVVLEPPSIVLSHCPPYGYFDDVGMDVHIGSRSVLRLMQANRPFMLICGHVHEHRGHINVDGTNIIKLGPAKNGSAAEIAFSHDSAAGGKVEVNWIDLF